METKKTPKADLRKKTGMFFHLGLMVSIGLTLLAFEYKSYEEQSPLALTRDSDDSETLLDIPIINQPPPPPPKEQPEIEEIDDDVEIEEKLEVTFNLDIPEDHVFAEIEIPEAPKDDEADVIFEVVEKSPEPQGGMESWNRYLQNNLKYPNQAKRMGVQGTVYVAFVVNTDGSIQDTEILSGIGAGCDEEALRVIKNAPKWIPGRQRGRPVRVKMSLPIRFKLN
jgi:periplasmic protein TonB